MLAARCLVVPAISIGSIHAQWHKSDRTCLLVEYPSRNNLARRIFSHISYSEAVVYPIQENLHIHVQWARPMEMAAMGK